MTETALATPRAQSEDQTRKVYIVLSQTGTILSRILKLYTRAPYNHCSIALCEDLELDRAILEEKLSAAGFAYDEGRNCFR